MKTWTKDVRTISLVLIHQPPTCYQKALMRYSTNGQVQTFILQGKDQECFVNYVLVCPFYCMLCISFNISFILIVLFISISMTGYAQSISAYKLIPLMFPLDISESRIQYLCLNFFTSRLGANSRNNLDLLAVSRI